VQIVVPIKRQLINDIRFKTISGIQFDPRDLGVPKSHPHKKLYACRCRSKSLPLGCAVHAILPGWRTLTSNTHWSTHSCRYTPNYLRKFAAVCLEPPADSDLEDVLAEGTYRRTDCHGCWAHLRPL
jgi:hypothetical protein